MRTLLILCSLLTLTGLARAGDPPIGFFADMSAAEESATTDSPGTGHTDFTLDRDTLRLSWRVTFKDLTFAPTGIYVHGPQRPGTNAGVQIDMAPKGAAAGVKQPIEGSVILTESQLEYLLSGRMYVNVHTAKYPEGELRGQIGRVPPKPPVVN